VDERNVDPVTNYLNAVDFQPGTSIVATGGWRGKVRLVDVIRLEDVQPPVDFGSVITSLAFHPRLPILAITGTFNGPNGGIAIYDLRQQKLVALRGHSGQIGIAQFSPDGSVLATGGGEGVIRLWNPESGKEFGTLTGHKPGLVGFAFSPDGTRLVSRTIQENNAADIKVWDVSRRTEVKNGAGSIPPGPISPDGSLQATRASNGVIEIWNTIGGTLRHRLLGHLADVPGLEFTSDSKRLASASRDQTLRLWDPREGTEVYRIEVESDSLIDVACSSDGSLLACTTQEGTVRVWDARLSGDSLRLKGHTAPVEAYGFTEKGKLLSRDTNGKVLGWLLPAGTSELQSSAEDPSPLPEVSPGGEWTVDLDRRDPTVLNATRNARNVLPFQPWQEEAARMNRSRPEWHSADAQAAESRQDWFAAAFHLAALLQVSENQELRQRLQQACSQLDEQQRQRPKNAKVVD
jgi:WD40 repeat protein